MSLRASTQPGKITQGLLQAERRAFEALRSLLGEGVTVPYFIHSETTAGVGVSRQQNYKKSFKKLL